MTILGDWAGAKTTLEAYPDIDGLPGLWKHGATAKLRMAQGEHAEAEAVLSSVFELCHERGAITSELHLLPLLTEARVRLVTYG